MPIHFVTWSTGAHTAFGGKICDTLWTAVNYGMYTVQFFMGNPYSPNRKKVLESDIEACRHILSKYPLNVFTHYPYVVNLAGAKNCLAWNGNTAQDGKLCHAINELSYELSVIDQLNCEKSGVVIHPGNYTDRQAGLHAIAKSINRIEFSPNARLLLENTAGQGTSLCTTIDEIQTVIDRVKPSKRKHVGVCMDTCHLYAYGQYDFSSKKDIDDFFTEFDQKIGINKFWLLHLNDSECPKGSRKDRHAMLGTGLMWGSEMNSLVYLLDKCKQHDIPSVLETHGVDMLTLASLGSQK